MHLLVRRSLLGGMVIIFALATPVVILHTLGFRLTPLPFSPIPVGIAIVETVPEGALVSVDAKQFGQSPEIVPNLSVGAHSLVINYPGYETWEKTIDIVGGLASEFRWIRLFASETLPARIASRVNSYAMSPNRLLLSIISDDKVLSLTTFKGEDVREQAVLSQVPKRIAWSPDSAYVLIEFSRAQYAVIDTYGSIRTPLPIIALQGASQVSWDLHLPGRLIAIRKDGMLMSYSIRTGVSLDVIPHVRLFSQSSRRLYVVRTAHFQYDVEEYTLQGQFIRGIGQNPAHEITSMRLSASDHIAVEFKDSGLAIMDDSGTLRPLASSVHSVEWSPDGQILLVQSSPNELAIWSMNEGLHHVPFEQLHLVVRLGREIRSPKWFAGSHHVIYQADDEIFISEIDTRDHPITYRVDSTNLGNANAEVAEHGYTVYYLKSSPMELSTDLYVVSLIAESDQ